MRSAKSLKAKGRYLQNVVKDKIVELFPYLKKKDISCGRVAVTGDSESNAYQAPETPSRKGNSINTLMGILKGSQSTPRRKRKYIRKNITVDKLQMKIPQLMDQNHQKKSDDIEANKS